MEDQLKYIYGEIIENYYYCWKTLHKCMKTVAVFKGKMGPAKYWIDLAILLLTACCMKIIHKNKHSWYF